MKKAYGFIEMLGLASAVVAADTALKAANVELSGLESAKGAGMHTLKLRGEVSSVKAAVSSILGDPALRGKVFAHTVIARPSDGTEKIIVGNDDLLRKEKKEKTEDSSIKVEDNSIKASVVEEEPKEALTDEETVKTEALEAEDLLQLDDSEVVQEERSPVSPENNEVQLASQEEEAPLEPQPEKVIEVEPSVIDMKSRKAQGTAKKASGVKKKTASCNLCLDPECPREKGEPRLKCIHYKEKE